MVPRPPKTLSSLVLPDADNVEVRVGGSLVRLTNLRKPFWPDLGITKGDLLRYYAAVSPALLPHIRARAMVMKRYPHGAHGEFFFMKRTPSPCPPWLKTCTIEHDSGNVIDFPMIDDTAALLWVVNLGCIDLNQWYARCDDVDRPDYLHFDLDPGARRTVRAGPRGVAPPQTGARHAEDAVVPEDERLEGRARLRPYQARADAERRMDVCESAGDDVGRNAIPTS